MKNYAPVLRILSAARFAHLLPSTMGFIVPANADTNVSRVTVPSFDP